MNKKFNNQLRRSVCSLLARISGRVDLRLSVVASALWLPAAPQPVRIRTTERNIKREKIRDFF